MEYTPTVDAIEKQLLSRNIVSLALDGWTSMNTQAITSIFAYYMERYWILCEEQLAFDQVVGQLFTAFES